MMMRTVRPCSGCGRRRRQTSHPLRPGISTSRRTRGGRADSKSANAWSPSCATITGKPRDSRSARTISALSSLSSTTRMACADGVSMNAPHQACGGQGRPVESARPGFGRAPDNLVARGHVRAIDETDAEGRLARSGAEAANRECRGDADSLRHIETCTDVEVQLEIRAFAVAIARAYVDRQPG